MFGVPGGATVWEKGAQSGVESRMSRLTTPRNGSDMRAPRTGGACAHGSVGERRGAVRPRRHPTRVNPEGAVPRRPGTGLRELAVARQTARGRLVERLACRLPRVQCGQQVDAHP